MWNVWRIIECDPRWAPRTRRPGSTRTLMRPGQREFAEFLDDVALRRSPDPGLDAARAALEVVETIYARSGYHKIAAAAGHSQP